MVLGFNTKNFFFSSRRRRTRCSRDWSSDVCSSDLYQGRVMKAGDYMTLLIENHGPGGFFAELARTFVLGKASQELRDAFAVCLDAQKQTVARLKPGASPADIHAAHNDTMGSRKAPPELRLFGHSQGYDLVERPLLRSDETMPLAA